MANEPRFVISRTSNGQYKFVLKAANGEIIATSETYVSLAGAKNGIASVRENAPKASIIDIS